MRVSFRVDASTSIGTGHVKRCLNLADELRAQGSECNFISSLLPGNIIDHVQSSGYSVTRLEDAGGSTPFDWQSDVGNTIASFAGNIPDWLVVDHYDIDRFWEAEAAKSVNRILVIDDLANRTHHCDLLLDGNINRRRDDYQLLTPPHCQLLVGREFLLLDPACFNPPSKTRAGTIVFLGGGDNQLDLEWLIPTFQENDWPGPVTVVLGESQPNASQLSVLCSQNGCDCLISPPDFKARCNAAAIAVVRCGLVSYELAVMGTPSFCLWKPGVHKQVAIMLEHEGFVRALDIKRFKEFGTKQSDIYAVQDMKPNSPFQTTPGQNEVVRQMMNFSKENQ